MQINTEPMRYKLRVVARAGASVVVVAETWEFDADCVSFMRDVKDRAAGGFAKSTTLTIERGDFAAASPGDPQGLNYGKWRPIADPPRAGGVYAAQDAGENVIDR